MKSQRPFRLAATTLAGLAISVQLAAQEQPAVQHHHYKLVVMGTFGGPENYLNTDDYFESGYFAESQDLNDAGQLAGWADTSTPDPNAPNFCFTDDCYVAHAFVWQDGRMQDLGVLPHGSSSAATWVSASGLVAGAAQNGEFDPQSSPPGWPQNRAVLWRDGKIIDLGVLPEEGGYQSSAEAVNSSGQVVGWTMNTVPDPYSMGALSQLYEAYQPVAEYYQMRAFIWQYGVMQDLGTLGTGNDAYAMAINEPGQVIGIAYTNTTPNEEAMTPCSYDNGAGSPIPTEDPFLWEHGQMIDLGSLGGTCGLPYWINNSGQVVGFSDLPGDQAYHAFLWTKSGGMRDLGTLGGSSSAAQMVNDSGQAVGGSHLPADQGNPYQDAFLWDGSMHDLGAIDGCSYAFAINARGQVVGNAGNACGDVGFLWEQAGPMVDLNTLISSGSGLSVVAALEINDGGEIAGAGQDVNQNLYAILLIPCDDNHPGVEGCDYSLVDASTATSATRPSVAPTQRQAAGGLYRGITPKHGRGRLRPRVPG